MTKLNVNRVVAGYDARIVEHLVRNACKVVDTSFRPAEVWGNVRWDLTGTLSFTVDGPVDLVALNGVLHDRTFEVSNLFD